MSLPLGFCGWVTGGVQLILTGLHRLRKLLDEGFALSAYFFFFFFFTFSIGPREVPIQSLMIDEEVTLLQGVWGGGPL